MPKVRRSKKKPPEGWEMIEPTLEEIDQKMREGKLIFKLQFYMLMVTKSVYNYFHCIIVYYTQLNQKVTKEKEELNLYGQFLSKLVATFAVYILNRH